MDEKMKKSKENNEKEKKKTDQKKKNKVDSPFSKNSTSYESIENMFIVGKSLSQISSEDSGIKLHKCASLEAIPNKSLIDAIARKEIELVPSNSSFISAKSDISDGQQKTVQHTESTPNLLNTHAGNSKAKLEKKDYPEVSFAEDETNMSLENIKLQLKEMERILNLREKKIKYLQGRIEEFSKARDKQIDENKGLTRQIGLLNRQLQSMYDMLGKKDWKSSIDLAEFTKCKNKISELEAVISVQDENYKELSRKVQVISENLQSKEKELLAKNKELLDYKNKSTLEVCKLINQIDILKNEIKIQSDLLECRIQEAQKAMDDEIVEITQKLEKQYQEDTRNEIDKLRANFEKLADLPRTAIEKLLKVCEPEKIDLITFQKDWDKQQALLESKVQSMQFEHGKKLLEVKDSYEGKILFLKTQVESLTSQLKERKLVLDLFENELMTYKSNSSMNLLKVSSLGDDISSLKELYTTEIFSQKQVHKLQLDIFEDKVKTLSEEILFYAKNEEIYLQELENAKKMAHAFREKYEELVVEWEGRVERDLETSFEPIVVPELDAMLDEFKSLMQELKKSESIYEERLKLLESRTDDERLAHLKEVEVFAAKLGQLEKFQKSQVELDEIIQELIKGLGVNYTRTLDALTTSHVTELSLKHLELSTCEKRHTEEMDTLRNSHKIEVEELRLKIDKLEKSQSESSLKTLEEGILKQKIEELSVEVLKMEGMIAIKEETEQVLSERVRDLENTFKTKEENCKKELEDLTAKFLEVQILSSAKDELAKELQNKLNETEEILKKSLKEVDKLHYTISLLEERIKIDKNILNNGGDCNILMDSSEKFENAKVNADRLKSNMLEMFERVEHLEGLSQSSGDANESFKDLRVVLDGDRSSILNENHKLKLENNNLTEEIAKAHKTVMEIELKNNLLIEEHEDVKTKLEAVETEKTELLLKEKMAEEQKKEIQQRNEYLEENIQELTNKMDVLLSELVNSKGQKSEVFSISLQEVRVLYQEEEEEEELDTGASTSTFGCQTSIEPQEDESITSLLKTNEDLQKENKSLKMVLLNKSKSSFYEEMVHKFKTIQKELFRVIKERDELMVINEAVRRERDYFKDEMESLSSIREIEMLENACEDSHHKLPKMKEEIEKLTEYIKVLSAKLDIMKANNEILLSKSQEHLKHNQNLVSELEEAWTQRYEIEEQLAKVRKENAVLNQHRDQLEETNRRISSLVAEGKPSVVSWIKIHETVENIVDEVLALKTSFSSSTVSGTSTNVEIPRTTSELRMMTETLHIQLKNKTMLCDELIVQKETLEKELKNLECVLKDSPNPARRPREESLYGKQLDIASRQTRSCPLERGKVSERNVDCFNSDMMMRSSENAHLMTLKRLKKHLEDQVAWEETQFRENLETEIKELRTQMQVLEERLNAMKLPSDDRDVLEMRYEREVVEITLEFTKEVEKLKSLFDSEKCENSKEKYAGEIDRLKSYFENRWDDLKKRYCDVYKNPTVLSALEEKRNNKKMESVYEGIVEEIRVEYEAKLEEEKKKFSNVLEEVKQKHEREMIALEDFWTEKLSECETKCAIMKATGSSRGKSKGESEESLKTDDGSSKIEQVNSEEDHRVEGNQTEKYKKEIQFLDNSINLKKDENNLEDSFCISCLSNQSYLGRMEIKTDDDKLDIILQRDALKEMVTSMELIIAKLLAFIGQKRGDLCTTLDLDDTMYKSIHLDPDRTVDMSVVSDNRMSLDFSTIIQDLTENSLLNSSDQVRFELEKCMKQLQKDAKDILALSSSDKICLGEIIKKFEKEKSKLENEVFKIEEMQREMKKEIALTKERLNQWERNLEVVSEGYGEEIVKSKQMISLSDLKDKLKMFLADHCALPSEEINLLEEICRESERLQEEWKREKHDLQQQIDVADKQVQSLKKFLEEQATEREQEREAFDKEINLLKENLKAKERDNSLQNRTNREVGRQNDISMAEDSIETLEGQLKELAARLTESESNKSAVEGEFQNAVKKIWSLREVIQDLEVQLAEISEKESKLKKKVEKLELLVEEQDKINRDLKEELETCQNQNDLQYSNHIKTLEEELMRLRHIASQVDPDNLEQLNANLRHIESILMKKTKDLEQLHVSSANVSCSSPSEDVSIRDHLDATRCSTPDEMSVQPAKFNTVLPLEEIERVHDKLARHTRAEEVTIKYVKDLKMQLRHLRKAFEEVQTERDILLEKIDLYLKDNSSLKIRLEEQRCNAGLLQKQLSANLESQIGRLETDVEKLRNLCDEKDKQLSDLKIMLENTSKSLKIRETEALNKSKEENKLITTLRTDLANALNENEKLEDTLKNMREKLKESMTMPALMDSMLDEKNAEIDRLEKELLRLSSEKTSGVTSRSFSSDGKKRKIKFSEPDSFSENISSISPHGSDLRNCIDSFGDYRNSSLKIRRPVTCSTKLESISSIAPLQLSPRGTDSPGILSWKTSSPIAYSLPESRTPSRTSTKSPSQQDDFQQMLQDSKLQSEIESKQREISELNLEMDKLKRQLVEINQELTVAKTQTKEVQTDLEIKEEEIRKLKNNEKSLLMTIESLKKNHREEVDELQKKLIFEREKVEKVYEEIKALEIKKIEIEESFLSLKEDYNDKVMAERKTAEILLERIKILEVKNEESEVKLTALEKDMETAIKDSEETVQKLSKEISELKDENEKMRMERKNKTDAETQVEICHENLIFEIPDSQVDSSENIDKLKSEFDKMTALIGESNFNKTEAFAYAMTIKKLITSVLEKLTDMHKELQVHRKKLMECSVDELALKVQKELLLSASLDNRLLSNIEANTGNSSQIDESAGGDNSRINSFPGTEMLKLYTEINKRMTDLESERENLKMKIMEQQKVIRLLEDSLKKEKERILEEKERCTEDAKIMELLRVNLEKGLRDIKAKEKELKKEKQQRMSLEKEIEILKKQGMKGWESKKIMELNAQLESQKEKIVSIGQLLEEERAKNKELRLLLEESRVERISEKSAQKLMESDFKIAREQNENLKKELMNIRKLLNSRNVEIRFLKQKLNLQEIDIKALTLSNDIHRQSGSETSSADNATGSMGELTLVADTPSSILSKVKKLNSCVQRHVKESTEIGETLLYLSKESQQMKDVIRQLEQNDTKLPNANVEPNIEKKLWELEKGSLILDIEALKGENEILKHDLLETCKSTELLRLENSQLKKEKSKSKDGPNQIEIEFLNDRVSHLTQKYLRTESHRKALAWQKNFLQISLRDYHRSEEEAWKRMARRKKDRKPKRSGYFRVVALAVISIFRMKFIVRKWRMNALNDVYSLLEKQKSKQKLASLTSILNIYNEPVNPLSFQTQNIFPQSSSRILRTPPCRDPGPRSYSLDSKKRTDCFETFPYLQGSIGTARALP